MDLDVACEMRINGVSQSVRPPKICDFKRSGALKLFILFILNLQRLKYDFIAWTVKTVIRSSPSFNFADSAQCGKGETKN